MAGRIAGYWACSVYRTESGGMVVAMACGAMYCDGSADVYPWTAAGCMWCCWCWCAWGC